jgi:hypothetical protein
MEYVLCVLIVVGVVVVDVDEALDELPPQPRNVRVPNAERYRRIIFLVDIIDLVYWFKYWQIQFE